MGSRQQEVDLEFAMSTRTSSSAYSSKASIRVGDKPVRGTQAFVTFIAQGIYCLNSSLMFNVVSSQLIFIVTQDVRVMNATRFFYSFCVFASILVFFMFAPLVLFSSLVVHSFLVSLFFVLGFFFAYNKLSFACNFCVNCSL